MEQSSKKYPEKKKKYEFELPHKYIEKSVTINNTHYSILKMFLLSLVANPLRVLQVNRVLHPYQFGSKRMQIEGTMSRIYKEIRMANDWS